MSGHKHGPNCNHDHDDDDGEGAFNMDALQALIQQHLAKSEHLKEYPLSVHKRIHALSLMQDEFDKNYAQLDKEVSDLQRKYHERLAPLFAERSDIVSGRKAAEKAEKEDEKKGIPDFWYHALVNCEHLGALMEINEQDTPILSFLEDIAVEYLPDGEMEVPSHEYTEEDEGKDEEKMKKIATEGFKLVFTFSENKYFKGTKLTKEFVMTRDENELSLVKTEGSKIEWNDKCDPSVKLVKKAGRPGRGRGKKVVKPVFVEESVPSFFGFFSDDEDDMDEEDDEDDGAGKYERDYAAAMLIKERLIPHAVDYYTGKIKSADDYDDEDEDEDEDDEDEDGPAPAAAGVSAGAGAAPAVVENPECKQQ